MSSTTLTSAGLLDHRRLTAATCESCARHRAHRFVTLARDVAPFAVCIGCDVGSLRAERVAASGLPLDPTDTPAAVAERRAILETV